MSPASIAAASSTSSSSFVIFSKLVPEGEAGPYHLKFSRGIVRPNNCEHMDDDRFGGATGEFLEVLPGPLAPIKDRVWSGRPIVRLQHHFLRRLKVDTVKHDFYPCNHCLALVFLGLHPRPELMELCLCIISILCKHSSNMLNMFLILQE